MNPNNNDDLEDTDSTIPICPFCNHPISEHYSEEEDDDGIITKMECGVEGCYCGM
tara:strand:+ start:1338 stop:1502 length:165 start_codon:yes stop_codon:yes gene_type:complete